MAIQHATRSTRLRLPLITLLALAAGCAQPAQQPLAYRMVAKGSVESGVRVFQSAHYNLLTTLSDGTRVEPILRTLEAGHARYVAATGVKPAVDAPRMSAYVFQHRAEWEAFTRLHTGPAAPIYLRLHRGGYTYGDACAVVDQGPRDTLAILAHEGFHLFVATRFQSRPPPFIEEGLASTFESILNSDGTVDAATSASSRLNRMRGRHVPTSVPQRSLRTLLGMHAGNVIGLSAVEVDSFYGHAWMFVRFCETGADGRYRAGFRRLLTDAAEGRLSSADLAGNAAMVERYLDASLEAIEPAFRAFVATRNDAVE